MSTRNAPMISVSWLARAKWASASQPGLPVLFITGYADVAAMQNEPLPENMLMMRKPFGFASFVERVSGMLHAATPKPPTPPGLPPASA